MQWMQIVITAIVQGITELFPISSVGHAVLIPYLFNWTDISNSPQFLPFVVMLHIGTAIALLLYFWRDWVELIAALFQSSRGSRKVASRKKTLLLIIVATIPAAVIGKLFEHKFQQIFASPVSAAVFLAVNGLVLFIADRLSKRVGSREVQELSYLQSFLIGCVQVLALIPGFSRSGVTMTAGFSLGLSYEESARFSFLLATPVILGAGLLEVPKVIKDHASHMLTYGVVGGIIAGVVAFISTGFLMRYFHTHEVRAFRPFAVYCIIVGVVMAVLAGTHVHL